MANPYKARCIPVRIRVLHNIAPHAKAWGYHPADRLVEVYVYNDADVTIDTTDYELANRAFRLFNTNDGTDHRTRDYHDRGNRSLSHGDVVVVNGSAYACAAARWLPIEEPNLVYNKRVRGTVPLY